VKAIHARLVGLAAGGLGVLLLLWGSWAWPDRTENPREDEIDHVEELASSDGPETARLPPKAPEPGPAERLEPVPVEVWEPLTERDARPPAEQTDVVEIDLEQEVDAWPESWPTRLQPSEFARSSDAAFSECPPDERYTYLGVDCLEAPCVVMFYVARDQNGEPGDWDAVSSIVERCPPWNTDYPTAVERLTRCSLSKSCGSTEGWFLMISPSDAVDFASDRLGTANEEWKERLQGRCMSASQRYSCPEER
jgi:hypothetical protein